MRVLIGDREVEAEFDPAVPNEFSVESLRLPEGPLTLRLQTDPGAVEELVHALFCVDVDAPLPRDPAECREVLDDACLELCLPRSRLPMTRTRRIAECLARGWAEYRLRRIQRLLRAWAWAGLRQDFDRRGDDGAMRRQEQIVWTLARGWELYRDNVPRSVVVNVATIGWYGDKYLDGLNVDLSPYMRRVLSAEHVSGSTWVFRGCGLPQ